MQFLMLWSGDKPGMRKGIVQGVAIRLMICDTIGWAAIVALSLSMLFL